MPSDFGYGVSAPSEDAAPPVLDIDVGVTPLRNGVLHWYAYRLDGELARHGSKRVKIGATTSAKMHVLRLGTLLRTIGQRGLLVHAEYREDDQVVTQNTCFFVRPKHLELVEPKIEHHVRRIDARTFDVELGTRIPALWVWLDLPDTESRYSDNFFHLMPHHARTVRIDVEKAATVTDLRCRLRVRSLQDTWKERCPL